MCYIDKPTSLFQSIDVLFENKAVNPQTYKTIDLHDKKCIVWNSGSDGAGNKVDLTYTKIAGSLLGADITLSFAQLDSNEIYLFIGDTLVRPVVSEIMNVPVQLGYKVNVAVRKYVSEKMARPYNNCSDSLNSRSSFDSEYYRSVFDAGITYRQLNCLEYCSLKELTVKCDCSYADFWEESGDPSCLDDTAATSCVDSNKLLQDLSGCVSSCPLECDSVSFTNSVVSYQFDANKIKLKIFYEEMSYTSVIEAAKISVYDLVSTFGGTFGLFLGFSLLSFCELLQLMFDVVVVFVKVLRRKTAVQQEVWPKI